MSDSNRVRVAIVREVTPGTPPTNPKLKRLRITNAPSLAVTPETIESDEIDPSYQVTDTINVGQSATGDIGMEFSYDAQHELAESFMRNHWQMAGVLEKDQLTAIADGKVTVTAGNAAKFIPKTLVYISGSNLPANNGVKVVGAITGNDVSIAGLVEETPIPDNFKVSVSGFIGDAGGLSVVGDKLVAGAGKAVDFTQLGLRPGMFIKIGGAAVVNRFDTVALNDWVRVKAVLSATELQLTGLPAGWTNDTGASKQIKVQIPNADIINGITMISDTIVESFLDHAPVTHQVFSGMRVNTINLEARPRAIIPMTISFIGTKGEILDDIPEGITGATYLPPSSDTVINATSNVATLREGGVPIKGGNCVTSLSIQINNNFREDLCVGHTEAAAVGAGVFQVTGTMSTYFGDKSMVEKVIKNTESSLLAVFRDFQGQVVLWDMPRLKYTSGSPGVPGKNTSTTAELGYQAIRHPDFDYTLRLSKYRPID